MTIFDVETGRYNTNQITHYKLHMFILFLIIEFIYLSILYVLPPLFLLKS